MLRVPTFALLSILSSSLQAGTVMEMVTRDLTNPNGAPTTIVTQAQDGRMRVEPKPGDAVMLFKDDVIYNVSKKDKSYMTMDRATMKAIGERMNPAMKQMQEQLAKMPPEQRAQVEKMMGKNMPGATQAPQEIRKTTRTGKAAGHACSYVEVLEGGVLSDEFCVVPPGALKGSQELIDAAKKISALMQEMLSTMDAPWLKQMADRQPNFDKLGGVPVLSRHFDGGKAVHESTLQAIRSEALPAALFDVPAGYTRKEMMMR